MKFTYAHLGNNALPYIMTNSMEIFNAEHRLYLEQEIPNTLPDG